MHLNRVEYDAGAFKKIGWKETDDLEFLIEILEMRAVHSNLRWDSIPKLHLNLEAPLETFIADVQQWIETIGTRKEGTGIDSYSKSKLFEEDAKRMNPEGFEPLAGALAGFAEAKADYSAGIFLSRFAKKNNAPSFYEFANYSIMQDARRELGAFGRHFMRKFFDCEFNFCLAFAGGLMASLGFNAAPGKMLIKQIQGSRGCEKRLFRIKWERALVNYVVQFAESYRIPEVEIVSAQNSHWMQCRHIPLERALMRYDVTAKRCGFKKAENGNYIRKLI